MRSGRRAARLAILCFPLAVAACPSRTQPAARPGPQLDPHAKCGQSDPLVVEWDAAARGRLEAARAKGLIAVRYEGCNLQVLDCHAAGKYSYVGLTPKRLREIGSVGRSVRLRVHGRFGARPRADAHETQHVLGCLLQGNDGAGVERLLREELPEGRGGVLVPLR